MDKGGTRTNVPKDKETDKDAQRLIQVKCYRQMCQEKKEKEDPQELKNT